MDKKVTERINKWRQQRHVDFKSKYDTKVQSETSRILMTQSSISNLEKIENSLLNRLKNTKETEGRVMNKLESAISLAQNASMERSNQLKERYKLVPPKSPSNSRPPTNKHNL